MITRAKLELNKSKISGENFTAIRTVWKGVEFFVEWRVPCHHWGCSDHIQITTMPGGWTRWLLRCQFSKVQFNSVTQSCPTLCNPMNCSMPGLPVHHQLPELTQTHAHPVSDAIQPSHPLSSPSPPAPNPSQHQSLFQWVISSHEVAKVVDFKL